jgi:hypothetical protein
MATSTWTNLEYAAEARSLRHGPLIFLREDGAKLGRMTARHGFDLVELTTPVIPAIAGATAILFDAHPMGDDNDRPDYVCVETVPIIAWRIACGAASPNFIDKPASNQVVLIQMPDGRLLEPRVREFGNLEEARDGLLLRAQAEWDDDRKSRQETRSE